MTRTSPKFESAVETFESTGLGRSEAESYVAREVLDMGRQEAADYLDKSPSTVDSQVSSARETVQLPDISKIESNAQVGVDRDPAVIIWFGEGEKALRYRWDPSIEQIREETYMAGTVEESLAINGEPHELHEFALESVSEYLSTYRDSPDTCQMDWPHIWELLVA